MGSIIRGVIAIVILNVAEISLLMLFPNAGDPDSLLGLCVRCAVFLLGMWMTYRLSKENDSLEKGKVFRGLLRSDWCYWPFLAVIALLSVGLSWFVGTLMPGNVGFNAAWLIYTDAIWGAAYLWEIRKALFE